MQKVTAFLEKYSQWIAVAVGGIYLLLMVYSYLLKPPVTAKLGTETVMPDEIDKRLAKTHSHFRKEARGWRDLAAAAVG